MNEVVIDDSQRELCAVLVMRTMLTDYCDDTGVSFNDVFFRFVTSPADKMLFDYSTGLWMEGPDDPSPFPCCRYRLSSGTDAAAVPQWTLPADGHRHIRSGSAWRLFPEGTAGWLRKR